LQKWFEVFQSSFHLSNLKVDHQKNIKIKGLTCITPINLWLLKIYSTIFFKWIFNVNFSPRSSVFEAHFQKPSTLWKLRLRWIPLYKILNKKIIINHFKSEVLGATHNGEEGPFGSPFEIFIECSTQKLHWFHQN